MFFVGIDVASQKHDITITTDYGEVVKHNFTIQNNSDGFKKLRQEILSHTESIDTVRIGIEETGIYSKNISEFLALHGFTVHLINPILTSNSRKAQSIRLTKTDKIDSLAICRYIEFNYKRLNSYTPTLYTISSALKSLSRARLDKQKQLSRVKTEWTRLLDIYFPEFRRHFDQHAGWVYNLFYHYPTVEKIARMHISTLEGIIKTKGDRVKHALTIKSLAKETVGTKDPNMYYLFQDILDDINHYQKQIKCLGIHIEELVEENYSYLLTIPGVGCITSGIIIGEIGDISRFHSPEALVAYAGLDPIIYESGQFKAKEPSISKRGSKYLKSAIFTSTKVAIINPKIKDNKFRQKYNRKISEGKHHNSAICSVTKNMINDIYKLMNTSTEFSYTV